MLHLRTNLPGTLNGAEFTSTVFKQWATKNQVLVHYIQPGKPAQNGFIERFNRTYREDILDIHLFSTLSEVRRLTKTWLSSYNRERPHESLAGLPPIQFLVMRQQLMANTVENSLLK